MTFRCPSCNRELSHTQGLAGQEIRCPACQAAFQVPASSAPEDATASRRKPGLFAQIRLSLFHAHIRRAARDVGKTESMDYLERHRDAAIKLLTQDLFCRSQDEGYRAIIPLRLAKLGGAYAQRVCLQALQNTCESAYIRNNAVRALAEMGLFGISPFFEALRNCLSERSVAISAIALCETGRPELIPRIAKYVIREDSGERGVSALTRLDPTWMTSWDLTDVVDVLIDEFQSASLERRISAVKLMKQLAAPGFADILRQAIESEDRLSGLAKEALAKIAQKHRLREHLQYLEKIDELRRMEEKAEEERRHAEEERRRTELRELKQKISVGMSLYEVEELLGPPSSGRSGGDLLGMLGSVSGSSDAISSVSQRQYYVWRRPEGEWQLVFGGQKLVNIHSTP